MPAPLGRAPTLADKRSKEAIEREEKAKLKNDLEFERQRLIALGVKPREKPQWIHYIKIPDRNHYIGSKELIKFLPKDPYNEELRYNPEYHRDSMFSSKPYFRLFFRQLKANDKNKYLGYSLNPEEQSDPKFYFH
jgi:hypothetical protein